MAEARILVVDDVAAHRYPVARQLRHAGYRVGEADSGHAAIEQARATVPDLIVLDVRLPDMHGYEVVRRLRADPRTAHIPILHLSGTFTDPDSHAAGLEGGADGYLTHPIEPVVLIASVRALLRARRAERDARDAEVAWRTTFEAIADGVCVIDAEARIERWNAAFAALFAPIPVVPGQRFTDLVPAVRAIAEPPFVALADGTPLLSTELPLDAKWLRLTARPIPPSGGLPMRAVCVVTDVTRQRAAEARAQQAQRLDVAGRLAGGVAHEINNMMTVILGFADFLARARNTPTTHRRDIAEITKAAQRTAEIASQLLSFSRRQLMRPKALDLNATLAGMQRLLQRLVGHNREVILTLSPDAGRVYADAARLEQAVLNLALNARDAMPAGGRLEISTTRVELDEVFGRDHPGVQIRPGWYVRLRVTDTGVGMPPETLHQIFEPFFTTKAVGEGSGLGLATVYGIVKQSNGYIWAESTPGRGTAFDIYLPSVSAAAESMDAQGLAVELAGGHEGILVVDDEPLVRTLARRGLEQYGYTVLEAGDGEEALAVMDARGDAVALVIADIVMPKMDGRQLAERLRRERPGIPILFISGHTGDERTRRELLGPGIALLYKPFTPGELIAQVQAQLRRG